MRLGDVAPRLARAYLAARGDLAAARAILAAVEARQARSIHRVRSLSVDEFRVVRRALG